MVNRVVILRANEASDEGIDWSKIGRTVTSLPELYQTVKESRVDLIFVDESEVVITRSIASRIRRQNGLTDIWSLVHETDFLTEPDDRLDGQLPLQLGTRGITDKTKQILADKDRLSDFQIVGRSSSMKRLAETIDRVAVTNVSVLIEGSSGSGKELVARALHDRSSHANGPFVTVNCGAISEGLLESELFGHEKGAFTGSVSKRDGLFHKANGGTIFLDEIGEMSLPMQVKLLRVLEDGTYYPVGSSTPSRTDVRVVAATNRDLADAIAQKEFREDLYFRVGAIKLVVPRLMDRPGDILPLLQHFLENSTLDYSDSAIDLLARYDWPGNVRQLRNFSERMKALKPKGTIDIDDVERFVAEQQSSATNLPVSTGRTVEEAGQELIYRAILSLGNEVRMLRDLIVSHLPSGAPSETEEEGLKFESTLSMENMEQALIEQVLTETDGNRKEAARRLGIGERTLYRKLKKYNLS